MTDGADPRNGNPTPPQKVPSPDHILQLGMGFWASKTLLSAVELDLFTVLGTGPMTGDEIAAHLGLHPRSRSDFLDALVSLGLLARHGDGTQARYTNTADTTTFLNQRSPAYLGGILEMANSRLYGFWANLTEALKTGLPQTKPRPAAATSSTALYADEQRLEEFLHAMQGLQMGNFLALLDQIDLSSAATLCDLGGANGVLSALAVKRHPHLTAITFDLPPVEPIAKRTLTAMGVDDQVTAVSGDFFVDDLPQRRLRDGQYFARLEHRPETSPHQQSSPVAQRQRPAHRHRKRHRRHPPPQQLRPPDVPQHAHRNPRRLRLHTNPVRPVVPEAGFTHTDIVPLAGPTSAAIAHK